MRRGEIHAICGENGAGKSTLMKVLSGVYPTGSYDGEIVFDGEPVQFQGIRDSEPPGIVIIHQELALVPYLSIAENIFLGNERRGRGGLIDWNRANAEAAAPAGVGRPAREPGHPGRSSSASASSSWSRSPRRCPRTCALLILDEPTAALNDNDSAHLLDLLRRLRDRGITSHHDLAQAERDHRDRRLDHVIRDGRTVETLDMAPADVDTRSGSSAAWSAATWQPSTPSGSRTPGEEVLRVEDWTRASTPPRTGSVVDGANLNVRAGEVVGIAGLMGAGRTELAMSIFGRSYGRDVARPRCSCTAGRSGRAASPRPSTTASPTPPRTASSYGLNLIDDIRRNVSAAALEQARPPSAGSTATRRSRSPRTAGGT